MDFENTKCLLFENMRKISHWVFFYIIIQWQSIILVDIYMLLLKDLHGDTPTQVMRQRALKESRETSCCKHKRQFNYRAPGLLLSHAGDRRIDLEAQKLGIYIGKAWWGEQGKLARLHTNGQFKHQQAVRVGQDSNSKGRVLIFIGRASG